MKYDPKGLKTIMLTSKVNNTKQHNGKKNVPRRLLHTSRTRCSQINVNTALNATFSNAIRGWQSSSKNGSLAASIRGSFTRQIT